jgi:SAM-dependent methyltransferase
MSDHGPEHWDDRYAAGDGHHHAHSEPSPELTALVDGLRPGLALDLGSGRGRHAIWLAQQGWRVVAVDFSPVGVEQARMRSAAVGVDVEWVVADVRTWAPAEGTAFDLVVIAYMHLEAEAMRRAASWLRPGGRLLVLGHAVRNLAEGHGGPRDPRYLHTPESLREKASGLVVDRCEEVVRHTGEGDSIDVVLSARRAP